jgi:hypothetical protein
MDHAHSHWLRRIWDAYQRVPGLIAPARRTARHGTDANPPRQAGREAGPRDDFEETAPLVFPLH